tara:strand:+ start:922 stop:1584 length:663 start_codon:yes stop_codon:yes gene_type:complete
MADLVIKPSSGNLVLKDDQNAEKFKIATSTGNITHTGNIALGTVTGATITGATITAATINGATIENAPAGVTTKCFGFSAYLSNAINIANATWVESGNFGTWTERWDTDSKFDTSNGRFTPGIQGIYLCGYTIRFDRCDDSEKVQTELRRNGNETNGATIYAHGHGEGVDTNTSIAFSGSSIVQLDTDDYVSAWVYHQEGNAETLENQRTEFWAIYQGQV